MTRGVKSASEDTRAKASGRWVCRISTASTARAMSLAFLPLLGSNCCTGRIAFSCNTSCHDFRPVLVQLPYARRTLVSPSRDSSPRITSMRDAVALSASMRSAICAGLSMVGPYARQAVRRTAASLVHDRRVLLRSHLPDLTPLRVNPAYRRLYAGFTLSNIGSQLAVVAIGLQVYDLTRSTAAVGVVGLSALVPLVVMGLYGGALIDHFDRRRVGLVAQSVAFLTSVACALQAWLGNTHVGVLYALVAVWNGAFAVTSPARTSIYPRILERDLLPAANALSVFAMNGAMTVGPLLAGFLVDWGGFKAAYTTDAII